MKFKLNKKRKKSIIIVGVILLAVLISWIILIIPTKICSDFECFKDNMRVCSNAVYINEDSEASWRYEIKGHSETGCDVEVKILQAKKGSLEIDRLNGLTMSCDYPRGVSEYPGEDLENCHGILKEELQNIIIKKLHTHIIENLGKIEKGIE